MQVAVSHSDNTSADNLAMNDAATRPKSLLDVKLAIVTGRAAHSDPDASIEERDNQFSEYIHVLNTRRMAGYLQRAGRTTPVYQGQKVKFTRLRTVIKHADHADEHHYDTRNDWDNTRFAGDFVAALTAYRQVIASLKPGQKLMVLVGGPCTELAHILLYCPDIAAHIGTVVIQAGDFSKKGETSNLKGGPGNSFNGAADSTALWTLLRRHKGDVYILPSNITKAPELALTIEDLIQLGARPELVDIYRIHAAKRKGPTFVHDLGLVMLAEQIIRGNRRFPYRYQPVRIVEVPHNAPRPGQPERRGTIVAQSASTSNRYVVTGQDVKSYRARVATYLRS
jgi:hypothetical protein